MIPNDTKIYQTIPKDTKRYQNDTILYQKVAKDTKTYQRYQRIPKDSLLLRGKAFQALVTAEVMTLRTSGLLRSLAACLYL